MVIKEQMMSQPIYHYTSKINKISCILLFIKGCNIYLWNYSWTNRIWYYNNTADGNTPVCEYLWCFLVCYYYYYYYISIFLKKLNYLVNHTHRHHQISNDNNRHWNNHYDFTTVFLQQKNWQKRRNHCRSSKTYWSPLIVFIG